MTVVAAVTAARSRCLLVLKGRFLSGARSYWGWMALVMRGRRWVQNKATLHLEKSAISAITGPHERFIALWCCLHQR